MMHIAIASLESASPYSQSRHYEDPKLAKELPAAYEERTWRSRLHMEKECRSPDGTTKGDLDSRVVIPGPAFAVALKSAAKRLRLRVPGKGQTEWTKYFEAGIMVTDGIVLPVKGKDVPYDRLFVPSDGKRGGGKRVTKLFPRIDSWKGEVKYWIFDEMITEDVFRSVLASSGLIVGIGRFRPESCGFYGRFTVKSVRWVESETGEAAAE